MKQVIARIKKGKMKFEIVVDGVKAWKYKMGEIKDVREVLVVEEVFKDAKRGDVASREALKQAFGTTDILKIAEIILKEGEVPMPTEVRRELMERKRRQIIEWICANAVDPRTKAPIPPQRVEAALEKARISIDPFKPIEKQINEIIKKLQEILPMRFERRKVEVRIPPKYAGKLYGIIRKYNVLKEIWGSDGSLTCVVELPGGLIDNFISEISSKTKGEAYIKVIE